jgi:tetratricopeptide (TPR) repeat protein
MIYRLLPHFEEALADLTRAIELDPGLAWAIAGRGDTYRIMRRYEEALADFTRAIELDPGLAWAIADRGNTCRVMGRYEEALADLSRAIELDTENAWPVTRRGEAYWFMGRYQEAVADLTRAIELDPQTAAAFAVRGHSYWLMGSHEEALADFTRASEMELAPTDGWSLADRAWAFAARGRTHRAMGNRGHALADLERAVKLDPANIDYLAERAMTRGIAHNGDDGFQCVVDVEVAPAQAASLARAITDWLVFKGVLQPSRTACVPDPDGGYAPGPSSDTAVTELFPGDCLTRQLHGAEVRIGPGHCHPLNANSITCPSCGARIDLRDHGLLAPAWEQVINVVTLWDACGTGILTRPACGAGSDLSHWGFNPPWAFGCLAIWFWNWPPLATAFISGMSQQLGHRLDVIIGKV